MSTRPGSMRLLVHDSAGVHKPLVVDADSWRALLQHLVDFGLDVSAADRLVWYLGGEGASIGPAEAKRIADLVRRVVLPAVPQGSSLILPATGIWFDHSADDTLPPLSFLEPGASPRPKAVLSRMWLEQFAELCSACSGLDVLAEGIETPWGSRSQP